MSVSFCEQKERVLGNMLKFLVCRKRTVSTLTDALSHGYLTLLSKLQVFVLAPCVRIACRHFIFRSNEGHVAYVGIGKALLIRTLQEAAAAAGAASKSLDTKLAAIC